VILDPWLAVVLAMMFAGAGIVIGALLTRVRLDLAFHRLEVLGDRVAEAGEVAGQGGPIRTSRGWEHPPTEDELESYLRGQAGR
jgi:hypothetical protein